MTSHLPAIVLTFLVGVLSAYPADDRKQPVRVRAKFNPERILWSLALSPDGKLLAVGDSRTTIHLYDLSTGKKRHELTENDGEVKCLAFAPDGRRLASASSYGRVVYIWDTSSGKEVHRLRGVGGWVFSMAFSPDGKLLAEGSNDSINIWDMTTGKKVLELEQDGVFGAVAFSPDGRELAAVCMDKLITLYRWDLTTGKLVGVPAPSDTNLHRNTSNNSFAGQLELAYMAHGRHLLLGGTSMRKVLAWNAGGDRVLSTWDAGRNFPYALNPDRRSMVTTRLDGSISVREVMTLQERHERWGRGTFAERLACSVDGRTIAATSGTTIWVWEREELPPPAAERLDEQRLETLWKQLAGEDAGAAGEAINRLVDNPRDAVPFLAKQVRPVATADAQKVARLIADLDARDFASRQRAAQELLKLGELVDEGLRAALAAKPPLEVQRRIEQLLPQLYGRYPLTDLHLIQAIRAIEALERIGTPEAQAALAEIAKGAAGARLTLEAQASLARLVRE